MTCLPRSATAWSSAIVMRRWSALRFVRRWARPGIRVVQTPYQAPNAQIAAKSLVGVYDVPSESFS